VTRERAWALQVAGAYRWLLLLLSPLLSGKAYARWFLEFAL
jgi:hypothetical protein